MSYTIEVSNATRQNRDLPLRRVDPDRKSVV